MNGIQPATSWTETRQAIDSLFKTIQETPLSANIWSLVEEQVAANSGKPMWTFFEEAQDSAATYDDVRALVDRTAAALYEAGVRKGSHVAVMLPNIPQFPATWLAIAKLGAVMV